MPIFSQLMFQAVHWAARRGLREEGSVSGEAKKLEARRAGVRGETYAYWYLRRNGYVFVARNYTPRGIKGELELVGYDGKTLAFVQVRTRTVRDDLTGSAGAERHQGKAARRGAHCAALPLRMPCGGNVPVGSM
jgi:putative endonuclease